MNVFAVALGRVLVGTECAGEEEVRGWGSGGVQGSFFRRNDCDLGRIEDDERFGRVIPGYDDARAMWSVRYISLFARLLAESEIMIESEMFVTNACREGVHRDCFTNGRTYSEYTL